MALQGSESSVGRGITSGFSHDANNRVMTASEVRVLRERMNLVLQQVVRELAEVLEADGVRSLEAAASSVAAATASRELESLAPSHDRPKQNAGQKLHAQIDALKRQLLEGIELNHSPNASSSASAAFTDSLATELTHPSEDNHVR